MKCDQRGSRSEAANGLRPGGVINEKVALAGSPPAVFRERHLLRGGRQITLAVLAFLAVACVSPTSSSEPQVTRVIEGTLTGPANFYYYYFFRPAKSGVVVASLTWTSTPLTGEVAKLPAIRLTFSGDVGPSETPPLTASRTVDPSNLSLFGSYTVAVFRTNECACRVDFTLTLKGPLRND